MKKSETRQSVFSSEVLMTAPADLEATRLSNKYRLLRKDLLTALMQKAWGVRVIVTAETSKDLRNDIHKLQNAAKNWERFIKLRESHGLLLRSHAVTSDSGLEATLDLYFAREEKEE